MINILATSKVGIIFSNKFPGFQKSSPSQKRKQKLSSRDFRKIKKSNFRQFLKINRSNHDIFKELF